jgi:hypothetical protein
MGYLLRLVGPGGFAPAAEIEYAGPAFKKADDLFRTNLQPLRDFGGGKVFRQFGEARC